MIIQGKYLLETIRDLTKLFLESVPDYKDRLANWAPDKVEDIADKESQEADLTKKEKASTELYNQALAELTNIKH